MKKYLRTIKLLFMFAKNRKRKYKALKRAKQLYLDGFSSGMCCSLEKSLYQEGFSFIDIKEIIPEFNPIFLQGNLNKDFWWDIKNVKARLEAFDKLIKLYE